MFYKIGKNSTTEYPNQETNFTINVYKDEDLKCENTVYWLPFTIDTDLLLEVPEEEINSTINKMAQEKAKELYSSESFQKELKKVRVNQFINAPEILDPID